VRASAVQAARFERGVYRLVWGYSLASAHACYAKSVRLRLRTQPPNAVGFEGGRIPQAAPRRRQLRVEVMRGGFA